MSKIRTDILMIVNKYCLLDIADDSVRSSKVEINRMIDDIVKLIKPKDSLKKRYKRKK